MIKNVYCIAECSKNKKDKLGGVTMKRNLKIKKLLKMTKGFSMVELLIGLLIIAVIAAASLTLLGGVLNTSKTKADQEAAETIKRAIEGYMHATNDTNLSCLAVSSGSTDTSAVVEMLSRQITINADGTVQYKNIKDDNTLDATFNDISGETKDSTDVDGTYGPFLDAKKGLAPQSPNMKSWQIHINVLSGSVLVKPSSTVPTSQDIVIVS